MRLLCCRLASPLGGKLSDWHLSFSNIGTNIYAQSHIFQTGLPSSQKNSRPAGEEKVPGRRPRGRLRVLAAFSSAVWTRQKPDSTKSVGTPGRNKSVCWVSQKNIQRKQFSLKSSRNSQVALAAIRLHQHLPVGLQRHHLSRLYVA